MTNSAGVGRPSIVKKFTPGRDGGAASAGSPLLASGPLSDVTLSLATSYVVLERRP
jgi:hypothetical protein